jgi:hypothetical protein
VDAEACHRESGVATLGTYDLTDSSGLSVWVTGFQHSAGPPCQHARVRFRLERGPIGG